MNELLPCPFCGNDDPCPGIVKTHGDHIRTAHVYCDVCFAVGPKAFLDESMDPVAHSVCEWNNRIEKDHDHAG